MFWSRRQAEVDGRITALTTEVKTAEDKLRRLYQLVEEGVTDLDDMLKKRLASLKADRDRAKTALDRIHAAERPPAIIAPELVTEFGMLMWRNITEGTIPFRKAWLRSIVDRVEVDADTVRISGDEANLEQVIAAGNTGALQEPGVRSSVRKWRARHDSNV